MQKCLENTKISPPVSLGKGSGREAAALELGCGRHRSESSDSFWGLCTIRAFGAERYSCSSSSSSGFVQGSLAHLLISPISDIKETPEGKH